MRCIQMALMATVATGCVTTSGFRTNGSMVAPGQTRAAVAAGATVGPTVLPGMAADVEHGLGERTSVVGSLGVGAPTGTLLGGELRYGLIHDKPIHLTLLGGGGVGAVPGLAPIIVSGAHGGAVLGSAKGPYVGVKLNPSSTTHLGPGPLRLYTLGAVGWDTHVGAIRVGAEVDGLVVLGWSGIAPAAQVWIGSRHGQ